MAHQVLDEVNRMDLPPERKLREAIVGHVKVLTTDFVVGTIRQQELLLPHKMRAEVVKERDVFEEKFLRIIRKGIASQTFAKEGWKMKAYAILGALNWIPLWYSPRGPFTPDQIAQVIADYLVKGLLNPDGKGMEAGITKDSPDRRRLLLQ